MTDDRNPRDDDAFSLFDTEERVLAEAEAMIRQLHEVARGVQNLADAYRRSYREQQRLVRLSDRMQHELQVTKDKLFRMATTDPLTGAVSRRHLFELGKYEITEMARSGGPLTALLIDFDNFKQINDTYGHLAGDEVLKRFAEVSMTIIRKTDILARYGGEEFVILLPGTTPLQGLEIAERLRCTVAAEPVGLDGGEILVTVSIGLATLRSDDSRLENLLSRADTALYEAKRSGRNRVVASDGPT
jgi:diguanylate cyclase (GGDEF)-like protein